MSHQDSPKIQMPTVVGKPTLASAVSLENKDLYIGREAIEKRDILSLSYPVRDARIENWDELEELYNHIFYNELVVDPAHHKAMIIIPPDTTRAVKEQLAERMFQNFSVHGLYLANSSVLSLFATGKTTGLVIESGLGQTYISPIYEGYAMPHATLRLNVGGDHVTKYLASLINRESRKLHQGKEYELAQEIKLKECYLSPDFQQDLNLAASTTSVQKVYMLPDEKPITLNSERFKAPEILFQPNLIEMSDSGIHELSFSSIMKCEQDIRKELFGNIVLSGGNTMFPRIKEKLKKDIKTLAPSNVEIQVKAPPERRHLPWIGAAILSSIEGFGFWMTKQEYDADGPTAIHRKSF